MTPDGLFIVESSFGPKETMDRLVAGVERKDMTVFARIDHAAGAASAGMTLRPTELLIFGSAKGGTPLMQQAQAAGIDLPLKMLVWQDENRTTRLAYNDPAWIARRHGIDLPPVVAGMTALLREIANDAAGCAKEGQ